jgi:hypothetical protein
MLCDKRADIVGRDKSGIMNYWYKRISCTLHKGNAKAIAKRILEVNREVAGCRDESNDPRSMWSMITMTLRVMGTKAASCCS